MEPTPAVWERTVEIQITTIVMHAWSEVEHDLIYKNPYQLPPDPTIDRMVDAVIGLAITNEILLQQLQQTFQASRRTEEEVFTNPKTLTARIFQHYPDLAPKDSYLACRRRNFVHVLVDILYSGFIPDREITWREVKNMIQKRAESPDQDQPIPTPRYTHLVHSDGFHLLRNLLQNVHKRIEANSDNQSSDTQRLHKFLLASSTYSLWYGVFSCSEFFTPSASQYWCIQFFSVLYGE